MIKKKVRNLKVEKLQFLYPSMTMCNSYSSFQPKKGCACGKIFPRLDGRGNINQGAFTNTFLCCRKYSFSMLTPTSSRLGGWQFSIDAIQKIQWTSLFKKIWKIGLHQLFHGVFSMKHLTFLHIWNSSRWFWGEFVARFWCSDLQNHPDTTSFQFPFCSPASRWSHDIDAGGSLKPQLQTFQEYNFQTFPKSGISSKKFQVSAYFFIPNLARICDVKVNGWVFFSVFYTCMLVSTCPLYLRQRPRKKKTMGQQGSCSGRRNCGKKTCRTFGLAPKQFSKWFSSRFWDVKNMADWWEQLW